MGSGEIIAIVLVLCCALSLAYSVYSVKTAFENAPVRVTKKKNTGDVLVITEDGASREGGGGSSSTTETYLLFGDPKECRGEKRAEWCDKVSYDQTTDGLTFFYDLGFDPNVRGWTEKCQGGSCTKKVACPDGGFECAYVEKFDASGALVEIVNEKGEQFLDKMADDVWAGKLDDWEFKDKIVEDVEYANGKMTFNRDVQEGVKKGDELSLKWANSYGVATMYFIALLTSMKLAGEKKPAKIVLNVKGAKEAFEKRIA